MSLRVVECRFVLSSVTSLFALSLRVVALSLCVVALSLRVVQCQVEQKYRPWHATMRYQAWQCDTTHDNTKRYFIKCRNFFCDFYTATPDNAKRHMAKRSYTRQCEAILDNAKRHSTMRSDILTNIVSWYCIVLRLPVTGQNLIPHRQTVRC
jgi:hypothetical protein